MLGEPEGKKNGGHVATSAGAKKIADWVPPRADEGKWFEILWISGT